MSQIQYDRSAGILTGLAAGDLIGGPTRMAVRLAESLIDKRCYDPDDVLTRYLQWWQEGAFDTGPTAAHVFEQIALGVAPDRAVRIAHDSAGGMSAGCNPAHRCPPLAMASFLNNDELLSAAKQEAALTHFDPLAGEVAGTTTLLCRLLAEGVEWPQAISEVAAKSASQVEAVLLNPDMFALRAGGYALDVLHAAIHLVAINHDFESALNAAFQFAGPANYCPVLVGAIAGARWGSSTIPAAMLTHCEILPRVQIAVEKLASMRTFEPR